MTRLRSLVFALTLAGTMPCVMSQDVKALVHDLRYPGSLGAQKARELLQARPMDEVTRELARALAEDPDFKAPAARWSVYKLLSDVATDRFKNQKPIERVVPEQLKAGLAEAASGTRTTAVEALALSDPAAQEEVASWISPLLEDASLDVAAAAARALERFGPRAAKTAPALLKLLRDPDEEARRRWKNPANEPFELFGKTYHTGDREITARTRAAAARIAVLESLSDFDLYPLLDEKGRLAGAMASVGRQDEILPLLKADPHRARQQIAIVAPLLDAPPSVGNEVWKAPFMVWARITLRFDGDDMKEARDEALARIEAATRHPDSKISQPATETLKAVKKYRARSGR